MAIPAELSIYKDEADFRDRLVIPLLSRMGFSLVVNYHGQREFGRDIIFGEIDRFGHVVFSALQAKFLPSLGQKMSYELIDDAKKSFAHEFNHPQRGTTEYISRFYVVNGGSIATNARDNFFKMLEPPIRANSVLIDGNGIVTMDRLVSLTRGADAQDAIAGVIAELNRNDSCNLPQQLRDYLDNSVVTMARLRIVAVSGMLERPVFSDDQLLHSLCAYWHYVCSVNKILDSVDTPLNVPEYKEKRVEQALRLFDTIAEFSALIRVGLQEHVSKLGATLV